MPRFSVAVLGLVVLAEVFFLAPPFIALLLVALAAWFALPGVYFVYRALGSTCAARSTAWLVGPALGFGLSVFGLLLIWVCGVQNWLALLLAPGFTFALGLAAHRLGGPILRLPLLNRRDVVAAACVLLIVPIITFAPYHNIRARVPDGEAYRAYFTADFIWAMAVTSELAKGDLPPANPFHHSEPMRYYWMSHLLSGAVYRNVQPLGVASEPVILVNGLGFGLAFAAFFYWLARSVGGSVGWALVAVLAGFGANSYEGADMIRAIVSHGDPWARLQDTNIDAVTRWFYHGMAVDGLQRLLLYQPHHLTGYAMALAGLWLVSLALDVAAISVALWAGILLGLAFLFSSFTAIIMTVAIAVTYAGRLVQQRAVSSTFQCALVGAAPVAVGVALAQAFGYTNSADGLLMTVGVNAVALTHWPWVVLMSFGPLLIVGVPGLLRRRWVTQLGLAPGALAAAALAFYFLVDVPDMGGVWVGWRSGHMLLIAFAVVGAAAMSAVWARRQLRLPAAAIAIVALALAVPTVVIDVFNAQDIDNRKDGAGFPWTLIITPDERAALDWIRDHTPLDAIVQDEPYVRDPATWAYIPAFAERRMAGGLPISMIPRRHYELASNEVYWGIFRATSADEAYHTAELLGVDYILIGAPERRMYGGMLTQLAANPDLFEEVFKNNAAAIFKVVKRGRKVALRTSAPVPGVP